MTRAEQRFEHAMEAWHAREVYTYGWLVWGLLGMGGIIAVLALCWCADWLWRGLF